MSDEKLDKIAKNSAKGESKLAGRDVVYIDTEDDITSIIEKVKNSANSVVALVPPARIGVLQSVVNLKLLQRAAKSSRKKLSLVTNDRALVGLAAGLKIPVAKTVNAQAEIPSEDRDEDLTDNNDVINGDEIAIGELAGLTDDNFAKPNAKEDKEISAAVASIETDDKIANNADDDKDDDENDVAKPAKIAKIPDFNSFRKKLLIIGGIILLIAAFLVWAIVFAPHGTITIKAQTTKQPVSVGITLSSDATNVASENLNAIIKQQKTTQTLNFNATGQQQIGDKATGTVIIYNDNSNPFTCNVTTGVCSSNNATIPAGTSLATSGGQQFTTDAAVTVKPGKSNATAVTVTAADIGTAYNIDADTNLIISGHDPSVVYAVAKAAFTGGTSQTVTVVQQSDVDTATDQLKNQIESGSSKIKSQLISQLGDAATALGDSFSVSYGQFTSSPAVGASPSSGSSATLSVEVTYMLVGVANSDLNALLNAQLAAAAGSGQKIYDNGFKSIKFADVQPSGDGFTATVTATGSVGPALDANQIKQMSLNKQSGEITDTLSKVQGVNDVQVKFSPFWVSKISDAKKLTVNFTVDE